MNRVLDEVVVGCALVVSVGYALASLGPKGVRHRILSALAQLAARAPPLLRSDRIARRLTEASVRASRACGGCGSCGFEESTVRGLANEIKIPAANIGKRD